MCVSLFYNKLHHPLLHGPISNTTQSVPTVHLLFTLPTMQCKAKGVKVVCIVNKCKLASALITGYQYHGVRLNDDNGRIVLMEQTMTNVQQR